MKFVYFGYDFMLPAIRRLLDEGHDLAGILSFEVDNIFNFNTQCQALAEALAIPFILDRPAPAHLESFRAQGTEVFLSAGYPYKIPPLEAPGLYAVNVHPTALPRGRGLMPIPRLIMDHNEAAAGFTAHKMTQIFDGGDILLQEKFALSPRETVETYAAKIAMRAPGLFSRLFADLPGLWNKARPQDEAQASHYAPPSEQDRHLDWSAAAAQIDRTARAFGRFGCLALIEGQTFVVYDLSVWTEAHEHPPGRVIVRTARDITLACADGYVCLKELYAANG